MEHFRVLIIGAGASGIAAAARLLEKGFINFKILEAESRIGGRVNTTYLGKIAIEIGAEWIHGESGNIVYELASKYNLTDNSGPKEIFMNISFFDSSGMQINKDVTLALTSAFTEIMSPNEKNLSEEIYKNSVGNYFEMEFQKAVDNIRKKLNVSDALLKKFLKTFENWENSIDASHSWYETSLCGHFEYWECDGNILTQWKNNQYNTIFDLLTKKIPNLMTKLPVDEKILFNKEVSKIIWNNESEFYKPDVLVHCTDGSVYSAEHILVTCSLGVLKERAKKMFFPTLPPKKLSCIENLGFGTVDKIFLKFSHPWWKDNLNGFAFLWSEEERKSDSTGWLNGVICFHPIKPKCPILRGWITGEAAKCMELCSNQEIVEKLNYLLYKFLGSSFDIPPIEICLTSNWYKNPHFRGSYSCRLLKSEKADVWASDLAEPVFGKNKKPILLFGGEATHDHYFSTVHGAVESGQREANRLLPFVMEKNQLKTKYQVTIIGAGISGLAASKTLLENGINDVILLESQSKPGGRISTLKFEDYNLELGAQWIHGEKNKVFEICQKNNLLSNEYSSEGEGIYLQENGEIIDEKIIREVDDIIKTILEECENYAFSDSNKKIPKSIGQELLTKFNNYLNSCTQDSAKIKQIKKDLFDWHVRFQIIDNSCSDLFNLSAKAWGLYRFCGGNDYVNFKNGYSTIIDTLVNSLPKNMILLETPVQHIDWVKEINIPASRSSSENLSYSAKVTCNNGLTFFTDYVIVTTSLGYLKSNYKTMFRPPLPYYLSEAIDALDFGVIDKIFLKYDKPWWNANVKGFQFVWSQLNAVKTDTEKCWGRYLTGFDVINRNKAILLGWIGGEGAKIMEKLSEEDIGRQATELLRKFNADPTIPLPQRVIRSTWWSNKYIRGGYSHITVKCDKLNINGSNLLQPVSTKIHISEKESFKKPTVLLAGESTHKNYFATVHGAYESGVHQATVLVNEIQNHSHQF